MRLLLGTHQVTLAGVVIPAAGLLRNRTTPVQNLGLTPVFVFDRTVGGAEAVQVLKLDLGAELLLPDRAQRDIHIAPHLPLFHIAVADAAVLHDLLEPREIGVGLIGGTHIRFADRLQKRNSGTVVVGAGRAAGVIEFGRVLFKMDPGDADPLLRKRRAGESGPSDPQLPPPAEREVVLADLVVFDQVGIEVALAVELAEMRNFAAGQQPGHDRLPDRLVIRHRQRAGIPHADRTDQGVRLRAEPVRAGAEHLARRSHLNVDFQTNYRFVFHRCFRFVS